MDDRPLSEQIMQRHPAVPDLLTHPPTENCLTCRAVVALRRLEAIDATEPVGFRVWHQRSDGTAMLPMLLPSNTDIASWRAAGWRVVPLIPKPEADQ